jgi:hypothetical protein
MVESGRYWQQKTIKIWQPWLRPEMNRRESFFFAIVLPPNVNKAGMPDDLFSNQKS